jgi:thiamine-phosphate pyrophosphorylase
MKLIVVTSATRIEDEHKIIERMFRHGLKYLHVRKPRYSRDDMIKYLNKFSTQNRKKIVIHSHHSLALSMGLKGIHFTEKQRKNKLDVWKKFNLYRLAKKDLQITTSYHKLKDIDKANRKYDYVFFSPVFESISKEDHQPSYSLGTIYDTVRNMDVNVVALGGIDNEKIDQCYHTGFYGVALSGYLWQSEDPVKNFDIVNELCSQYRIQS